MELAELVKANFLYIQLVERKIELSLELSRNELGMHQTYGKSHSSYDPDYGSSAETLREKHQRIQADYDSVCARIDQLKQDMSRNGYTLTPLEIGASTVPG